MKIGPVSTDGEVTVSFNQRMIAPLELDLSLYEKMFRIQIVSSQDSSAATGKFKEYF